MSHPEGIASPAMANDGKRKAVRRTVTILVVVVVAFFLLSFVQIVLMK